LWGLKKRTKGWHKGGPDDQNGEVWVEMLKKRGRKAGPGRIRVLEHEGNVKTP